ncbi:cholinesterase 2-like [Mercenaria mercenaria]|uniref:cholinesterase 2-like n=1 Tax=Mercenaria mercenaria TaxID=6596 RepID=UPI00234F787D|nr:cholinesterase 2-like [Mercenaria mercenaria]
MFETRFVRRQSFFQTCIVCLLFTIPVYGRAVSVSTKVGKISGYTENLQADGQAKTISKFMGIPFAETTAGQNRFLKPIPKAPFNSTFDATGGPIACIQSSKEAAQRISKITNFSEDCLNLNVYVPHDFTTNVSLPVMIWIYGGGFNDGASALYRADVLTAFTNVIVVTINYRLGMFGFLQSDDGKLPGNQGLWDQHLAIKWVHDNIAPFTGNPGQVTIFGESAGGASVLFQALYPGNKGYFQRVIAESGSPLANWATIQGPNAKSFAKRVGCDSSSDWIACLRSKSTSQLQIPRIATDPLHFYPAVDGDFVAEIPEDILYGNSSKSSAARQFYSSLDILSGVNNYDGALYMSSVWPFLLGYTNIDSPKITRDQLDNIVILDTVNSILSPKDNRTRDILQKVVIFEYTNWTDPDSFESTRTSTVSLSSDVGFFSPAIRAAQAHAMAQNGKTYFYEFSVPVKNHVLKTPTWITGSNHADEIRYVLCEPLLGSNASTFTEDDKRVSRAVATLWTNFAKSGNPNTPEDATKYIHTTWPEYTMTSQNYFQISYQMSLFSVKDYFYAKRMSLWSELIPKIRKVADINDNVHIPQFDLSGIIFGK